MKESMDMTEIATGRLVYSNGNGTKTFPLAHPSMTLGSEDSNDVMIKRPKISRTHARIDYDGRRWTVTDLDSVAGTYVNQQPIAREQLTNGDLIGIGAAMLRFETIQSDDGSAADVATDVEVVPAFDEQTIEVENDPPLGTNDAGFTPVEALVEVQTAGDKVPFFIVAAGYSDVAYYENLAVHLGKEQPIYVLQPPQLASKVQPTDSIEFLAAHYIEILRSVQAEGPYQLGGYNIGGIVAFEIARQLQVIGETVAALLLIDAPYPLGNALPSMSYRNVQTVDRLNQRLFKHLNVGPQVANVVRDLGEKFGSKQTPQMQRMAADYASFITSLSDQGFEINLSVTQPYRPASYADRVVLILAADSPVRYANTQWNWLSKVPNGLESRLVAGSYSSILREPDVQALAAQIAACLNRA